MNFLLHKQKCPGHIVPLPNGVPELMADISREVLRAQPENILQFIADFLDDMLLTRETTIIAQATIDDVMNYAMEVATFCMTTSNDVDMSRAKAQHVVSVFQRHFKEETTVDNIDTYCDDNARFNEDRLMQKLMDECALQKDDALKAMRIIRDAYKKYYYRRTRYEPPRMDGTANETNWKDKVKNTLYIYSKTKPTQAEMDRAATCLQAAYRGYCVRKKVEKIRGEAATFIQSVFRGNKARHELADKPTINEAARLIQNFYRGQTIRKSLIEDSVCGETSYQSKGFPSKENLQSTKDPQSTLIENESHLKKAALTIQSKYRANKIRQSLAYESSSDTISTGSWRSDTTITKDIYTKSSTSLNSKRSQKSQRDTTSIKSTKSTDLEELLVVKSLTLTPKTSISSRKSSVKSLKSNSSFESHKNLQK